MLQTQRQILALAMRRLLLIILPLVVLGLAAHTWLRTPPVSYNEQIRPIFNNKCITCHGGVKQSSNFSVLFREEALQPAKSGELAIVPGHPEQSELMRRVRHTDPEERMPAEHDPLPKAEIDLLERWIEEGAAWEAHWSFIPPDPAIQPPARNASWGANGIDAFILEKLNTEGYSPSLQADPATLIRRLSLDLTGLPPTLEEAKKFTQDPTDEAYEAAVDRLLASPRYGERWAAMWLDLARYGDSQGYQKDLGRSIWAYRDWLIKALNDDMPFDQFTIEQLAGDLLDQPTQAQLIATAFHRNTMNNTEGGTDNEEFRVAAVLDRVSTTFEIWQGLTVACVQCHSHPYDPIRHHEFYELFAFFNNTEDADFDDDRPVLRAYPPSQTQHMANLIGSIEAGCQMETPVNSTLEDRYDALRAAEKAGDLSCDADPQLSDDIADLHKLAPPRTPIMRELPDSSSRVTRVFERGNWLVHADTVQPNVPASLPAFTDAYPSNRLGLAQWLVSNGNPLTARVIVNRYWEQIFGIGIVQTLEDFGSQGAPPSHPELLDWLAVQFRETHQWSTKAMLKQIVMSATYRQSATVSPELIEEDPANRLLARGPRFRLPAEQIRDQALAVSGLLSEKRYGPSVMPPQPDGTWQVIRGALRWDTDVDEDRHRRGLYTFWRKSSPYPSMVTFDSPSREFCVSRRIRTNTPLQALVSLNDVVFIEAATALAHRMYEKAPQDYAAQLRHGYELALAYEPSEVQLQKLQDFYDLTLDHYRAHPEEARQLITDSLNASPELAALINSANVIMNLDEFINKP